MFMASLPNEIIIPFLDGNTNGKMVCLTNILKNPMIVGRCFGIGSKEDIMKEKHLDLCRDSVNSVFFQFLIPYHRSNAGEFYLYSWRYRIGGTGSRKHGNCGPEFAAFRYFSSVFCHRNAVWSRWKRFVFL